MNASEHASIFHLIERRGKLGKFRVCPGKASFVTVIGVFSLK
jgi:hypothetical protein